MHTKAAVIVGASVLAMAVAYAAPSQAQTRVPVAGSYVPSPPALRYVQQGGLWYYYYDRPAVVQPDPRREKPQAPPRPARGTEYVYANVEGGYASLTLSTLAAQGTLITQDLRPTSVTTSSGGAFYGVGGGFRLAFLTLGGRVRGASLGVGQYSTINGELGAHIAMNRFEPYFTLAAGYAKLSASGSEVAGIPDLDIHGWNARAGLGFDYYADKNFSIGVNFTGDVVAMARPGVDLSTSPEKQAQNRVSACEAQTDPTAQQQCITNAVHDAEGASAGFAGTASVVMGLHF